ncbi:helix-turn-helix domain-containing protein [Christensenella intestinihominis]|uniref:helix-turn-helix domain-containing protein n=1 Tax=Christensenella intestinihominis TaxID=1851429 RepID=UPI000835C947|nr:helix-turn-helix domain-containing protein [Christensenella intestinihominis]
MDKKNSRLLPFSLIAAASKGDIDAINAVVNHYSGYIAALSVKKLFDGQGKPYMCIDEELRRRLETKLITKILDFKVA